MSWTISEIEAIRLRIQREMGQKGFPYYLQQMQQVVVEIPKILADDDLLLDSAVWETILPSIKTQTYWEQESPWLQNLYKQKRGFVRRLFNIEPNFVTAISTLFLSHNMVASFVGKQTWYTAQQIILFQSILGTYFRKSKRLFPIHLNMDYVYRLSSQPTNTATAPPLGIFQRFASMMLAGSGTFMLKILQQINTANENTVNLGVTAEGSESNKVSRLAAAVFSRVPGLTMREFQELKSQFRFPNNPENQAYVTNMQDVPLGSASIGAVHATSRIVTRPNQPPLEVPAVIKYVKPIYAYYYLCEINFLLTVTWRRIAAAVNEDIALINAPKEEKMKFIRQIRSVLLFLIREFVVEFDYAREFANTVRGYQIYEVGSRYKLRSAVALDVSMTPFPVLIIQRIFGASLDTILNGDGPRPSRKFIKEIYQQMLYFADVWFSQTLWGSGDFHSDAHPANIFFGTAEPKSKEPPKLYLLDYGSFGKLSSKQQCALISALVSSTKFLQDAESAEEYIHQKRVAVEFIKNLNDACEVTEFSDGQLNMLADMMSTDPKLVDKYYFGELFLYYIKKSPNIALCVSGSVLFFGRAVAYLTSVLEKLQSVCGSLTNCPYFAANSIIKSNIMWRPNQVLRYSVGARKLCNS